MKIIIQNARNEKFSHIVLHISWKSLS